MMMLELYQEGSSKVAMILLKCTQVSVNFVELFLQCFRFF